ncbi:MAG: HIT family protein [Solirubrobacteraceae bacterium]
MENIFKKIISKEIKSHIIYEDEYFLAFLDIFPLAKGHTLVIPKKEVNKLFDLDIETYQNLMLLSHKLANSLEKAVPCLRVGMSVIGLEVPHAHVHLVPLNNMNDLNFMRSKLIFTNEELQEIATTIKNYI